LTILAIKQLESKSARQRLENAGVSCMTTYFVSRHAGAVEWASTQDLGIDVWLEHLDAASVIPGDIVAGTLPVHLAAAVCERGAIYLHLAIDMPGQLRGGELTAEQLEQMGARLEKYDVSRS
jgi:CRISPR-associated protein Csx16